MGKPPVVFRFCGHQWPSDEQQPHICVKLPRHTDRCECACGRAEPQIAAVSAVRGYK